MNLDLLKEFCCTDEDRPSIQTPWSEGMWSYASDGRIMVKIPRDVNIPENPKAPTRLHEVWKAFPDGEVDWMPLPEIPEKPDPERCGECLGSGRCICSCEHEHDCGQCDGTGEKEVIQSIHYGVRRMNCDYLRLIERLPNPLCAVAYGDKHTALAFKFDGGTGLVMPIKQED